MNNLSIQVIEQVLAWGIDDSAVGEAVGSCIAGGITDEGSWFH